MIIHVTHAAISALILAAVLMPVSAAGIDLAPTPAQPLGPFYPRSFPAERDSDLTRIGDKVAQGRAMVITGRILARDGAPVAGARVEIWQVNTFGRYHHEDDNAPRPVDPGFQGWGESVSGASGEYRFRTVVPPAYGIRAPHVHFAVSVAGQRRLVTQMYFVGAPENARDSILGQLSEEARARLTVKLQPAEGGGERVFRARFDIVLP